ncbi:unnamed protein product [Ranitomeya imitator]|uniref:Derlin n=1 Tax=Ranitomeya imitator TaxID=111125 RepID=A0ABN9LYZ4_9NEOB|nr:unnamed protein product [Ranitomeya imitator]
MHGRKWRTRRTKKVTCNFFCADGLPKHDASVARRMRHVAIHRNASLMQVYGEKTHPAGNFAGCVFSPKRRIATYRYCRMLEEGSFRGRTADFVFMFLFGGLLMTMFGLFVNLVFLGQAFTIMLVYVWSRRNPYVRMNFFGLLNFQAPFLPWVLMGFSLLLGNSIIVDLLGIAVGHIYFFLEDVFPNQPGGGRILKTPYILKAIFDTQDEDPNYNPLPEDRPGGFAWGEGQRLGG